MGQKLKTNRTDGGCLFSHLFEKPHIGHVHLYVIFCETGTVTVTVAFDSSMVVAIGRVLRSIGRFYVALFFTGIIQDLLGSNPSVGTIPGMINHYFGIAKYTSFYGGIATVTLNILRSCMFLCMTAPVHLCWHVHTVTWSYTVMKGSVAKWVFDGIASYMYGISLACGMVHMYVFSWTHRFSCHHVVEYLFGSGGWLVIRAHHVLITLAFAYTMFVLVPKMIFVCLPKWIAAKTGLRIIEPVMGFIMCLPLLVMLMICFDVLGVSIGAIDVLGMPIEPWMKIRYPAPSAWTFRKLLSMAWDKTGDYLVTVKESM